MKVADDPQRQLRLLVDERRRLGLLGSPLDLFPEALEEIDVALDVLRRCSLGRRADDHPVFGATDFQDVPEPAALLLGEPARDAEALAARHVDDEPARQRDLGRQAGAFRLPVGP